MSDHDPNEETIASLLHTIALIREAAGCGGEVMLSDLPAFVKGLRAERDGAVKTERERCLRILRSVNNYSNPMTAGDCADLIEKGEAQP